MGIPAIPDGGTQTTTFAPNAPQQDAHHEEYTLALQHNDFAEAARVRNKYSFNNDAALSMNREVFNSFFTNGNYEAAAQIAKFDSPEMEPEYQEAFQAWYRDHLLIENSNLLSNPSDQAYRNGNHKSGLGVPGRLSDTSFNAACFGAFQDALIKIGGSWGEKVAAHCFLKMNDPLPQSVCRTAYKTWMSAGDLIKGAEIATSCGWNTDIEKTMIEGFIDTINDPATAHAIAEKYGLYYKAKIFGEQAQALRERGQEREKGLSAYKLKLSEVVENEITFNAAKKALSLVAAAYHLSGEDRKKEAELFLESNGWSKVQYPSGEAPAKCAAKVAIAKLHGLDEKAQKIFDDVFWGFFNAGQLSEAVRFGNAIITAKLKVKLDVQVNDAGVIASAIVKHRWNTAASRARASHLSEALISNAVKRYSDLAASGGCGGGSDDWFTEANVKSCSEAWLGRSANESYQTALHRLGPERPDAEALKLAEQQKKEAARLAREEKKGQAEADRENRIVAETERKDNFVQSLVKADYDAAERYRKEGRWSNAVLLSLIEKALAKIVSFPADCNTAEIVRKHYSWVGKLCDVKETGLIFHSCKVECN